MESYNSSSSSSSSSSSVSSSSSSDSSSSTTTAIATPSVSVALPPALALFQQHQQRAWRWTSWGIGELLSTTSTDAPLSTLTLWNQPSSALITSSCVTSSSTSSSSASSDTISCPSTSDATMSSSTHLSTPSDQVSSHLPIHLHTFASLLHLRKSSPSSSSSSSAAGASSSSAASILSLALDGDNFHENIGNVMRLVESMEHRKAELEKKLLKLREKAKASDEKEEEKKEETVVNNPPSSFTLEVNANQSLAGFLRQIIQFYAQYDIVLDPSFIRLVHKGREITSQKANERVREKVREQKDKTNNKDNDKDKEKEKSDEKKKDDKKDDKKSDVSGDASVNVEYETTFIASLFPTSSAPLNMLLVVDSFSRFYFDSSPFTTTPSPLQFSNHNLQITCLTDSKWHSVRGDTQISSGRFWWKIQATVCNGGNLFVGIATKNMKTSNYLGCDDNSWGYYGCGNSYHLGSSSNYGLSFRAGDVITARLILEHKQRTLSFEKNGIDLGVAFKDLPQLPFFPAVSLYAKNDQIKLVEFGTF